MDETKIRVKRRGNSLGIWFFEILLKLFGLKAAYLLLEPVCLHYTLFDREAVKASMAYLEKRFPGEPGWKNLFRVHRLFVNQGRQLIDRRVITHRPDYFVYHEQNTPETLQALKASSKGAVLITSHVGNWQVALRQMGHLEKDICIVMRPEDNPAVVKSLRIGGEEAKPVEVIDPQDGFGGVIKMVQALQKGKLLCLMGDRGYGFDTLAVPFLGVPAHFPYGAFYVAASTGSPVIALLTHKISDKDYIADISNIWYPVFESEKNKKEQLRKWVESYVRLLEDFVCKHPFECFLFHDVWH